MEHALGRAPVKRWRLVAIAAINSASTCAVAALANVIWTSRCPSCDMGWLERFAVGYAAVLPFVMIFMPTLMRVAERATRALE